MFCFSMKKGNYTKIDNIIDDYFEYQEDFEILLGKIEKRKIKITNSVANKLNCDSRMAITLTTLLDMRTFDPEYPIRPVDFMCARTVDSLKTCLKYLKSEKNPEIEVYVDQIKNRLDIYGQGFPLISVLKRRIA
jgi:hypothetical protein